MEKYQIEFEADNRMSEKQIKEAIEELKRRSLIYQGIETYYLIKNKTIMAQGSTDSEIGNKIPISYGRKIINTITGYMYRPGNIGYSSENEKYLEILEDIFYYNKEDLITSSLGRIQSIYGVAYELHYIDEIKGKPVPRFSPIKPKYLLPIYDHSIDPVMVAAIRWSAVHKSANDKKEFIDVYYSDVMMKFQYEDNANLLPITFAVKDEKGKEIKGTEIEHYYGQVPVAEYCNNEEMFGDYQPVIKLIDAYDLLISDSMDEVERFALAYLILIGMSVKKEDIDEIKRKRVLELMEQGKAEFLTKTVDVAFIQFVRDWLKEEIHKQSQIPDMSDEHFAGNQSGVAIRYKLNDLENICTIKEIYFQEGLYQRIELIDSFIDKTEGDVGGVRDIGITFTRNIPANYLEISQIVKGLRGHVSLKTILEELVPFVENAQEEIDKLEEEQEPKIDLDNVEDEEIEDEEDKKKKGVKDENE